MWNVAGAPPKRTGRARPDDLGHRDAGEHVDRVEDRRPDRGDRRDQAHQRDRHDLDRDARLDAVDEVLAGVLAVAEVARRGDREDAHRAGDEVGAVGPEQLHHLDHPDDAVLGEGPRHDRLLRVRQDHVQAPGIGHLGLDVVVGREGRREIRDVVEPVADPDVLDEVGRVGEACLAGPVVEHLQPGRARHEVDPVAAQVRVRVAVAVVQGERLRGIGDRPFDDLAREQDPAIRRGREAGVDQPLAHRRTADLHADLGEDPLRLVEDPGDEVVVEDLERRSHRASIAAGHVRPAGESLPHPARWTPGRPDGRARSRRCQTCTIRRGGAG